MLISVIDREEGFRALFKGGPARVIRSSPQFGFTLLGEIDLGFTNMATDLLHGMQRMKL